MILLHVGHKTGYEICRYGWTLQIRKLKSLYTYLGELDPKGIIDNLSAEIERKMGVLGWR